MRLDVGLLERAHGRAGRRIPPVERPVGRCGRPYTRELTGKA